MSNLVLAEPFVPMLISRLSEIKIRPPWKGETWENLITHGFWLSRAYPPAHFHRSLEPSRNEVFSFLGPARRPLVVSLHRLPVRVDT
jgi:hypothetical protein